MKNFKAFNLVFFSIVNAFSVFICTLANQALAAGEFTEHADIFNEFMPVSDSELEQLRGGFALPNGVNVDFSMEKIVSLNGMVTFASTVHLPENITLAQNGIHNLAPELTGSGLGTVIQNNFDNQFIQTVSTINIGLSNLKNLNIDQGNMVYNAMVMTNLNK